MPAAMREGGRLVVVGGVAAGMSAASRARRLRPDVEIVVLEKGRDVSYGACATPYYIAGVIDQRDRLIRYDADFFRRERRIDVRLGAEAVELDPRRRSVGCVAGGGALEAIDYDALVAAPRLRPITGVEPGTLPTPAELGLQPDRCAYRQSGGRLQGERLLEDFLGQRGADYSRTMSSPNTAFEGCSRLSPHLAWGTLSIREVVQATRRRREQVRALPPVRRAGGSRLARDRNGGGWRRRGDAAGPPPGRSAAGGGPRLRRAGGPVAPAALVPRAPI